MPAHRGGFRLVPTSFFGRNPALDIPRFDARRYSSEIGWRGRAILAVAFPRARRS